MIFEHLFAVRSKSEYVKLQRGIIERGFNDSDKVFSLKQEPDVIEYVIESSASDEKILLIGQATANGIIITKIENFTNV